VADAPTPFTPDELEAGRLLFRAECVFELGVVSVDQLPVGTLPEVAFAGRSNVGKSSLINALLGRKDLARTSNTPGRTQQVNLFNLGGRMRLADLPGYGKAPKPLVSQWTQLIVDYLHGRAALRRVCLLVDSRHGLKPTDRETMDMLDGAGVTFQVILTKGDKVKPGPLKRMIDDTAAAVADHTAGYPLVLATSSTSGEGLAEVRASLSVLADT